MHTVVSSPIVVQAWPLLLTTEMAAMYLSVDAQRFTAVAQKLHLEAIDLEDGTLRWDRRDLDKRLTLLPKVLAMHSSGASIAKMDSQSIERLAQAVAEKLTRVPSSTPPSLVSIREATERLGVGRSTIYRMINMGDLEPKHIGRRTLIPLPQIERLLKVGA